MQPNLQSRLLKEGSEYDQFWKILGVKSEYSSQKIVRDQETDPHLFACTFSKGTMNLNVPTAFFIDYYNSFVAYLSAFPLFDLFVLRDAWG